jgi:ribose transport system ATP-binding protein
MSLHVAFDGITKRFGAVPVLNDVSFELGPGGVHALLGENGAGKSTLMKILAGYERASAGTVTIDGAAQAFPSAREAEAQGIVLIHQETNLADALTVAENIFLGHELRRGWWLDERAMRAKARVALDQVGLAIDPDTSLRDLIVAERQLVEIAKALVRRLRLLILDEPTASLTPTECERLFGLVARLRADGVTVIYISHRLDEVERITNEVIVMRDGRFVGRAPTAGLARARMVEMMIGRELAAMFPPKQPMLASGPPVLEVHGLTVPGWAEQVSFALHAGEILGFAGLVGAGRTELFEGLIGLRPCSAGTVMIGGRPARLRHPRAALDRGIAYLSEDRKGKALHLHMPMRDNLTLASLDRHARPWLSTASEDRAWQRARELFAIRGGDAAAPAAALSGGNQQKMAIAKYLEPAPRILVLDEPTRGVDVGAKREIYFLIARLAAEGHGLIVVSSELIELIGLCHSVVVMRRGRVMATVAGDRLTEAELLAHALDAHH